MKNCNVVNMNPIEKRNKTRECYRGERERQRTSGEREDGENKMERRREE